MPMALYPGCPTTQLLASDVPTNHKHVPVEAIYYLLVWRRA